MQQCTIEIFLLAIKYIIDRNLYLLPNKGVAETRLY